MKLNWEVIAEQAFTMGVNRPGPDYKLHEEPTFLEVDETALYGEALPLKRKEVPSDIPEEEEAFYYLGSDEESA